MEAQSARQKRTRARTEVGTKTPGRQDSAPGSRVAGAMLRALPYLELVSRLSQCLCHSQRRSLNESPKDALKDIFGKLCKSCS